MPMMHFRNVILATIAGAALVAASFAGDKAENLLKNGGFEEGPEAGDFLSLNKDSREIKGWKVTRGQIDYIGTHWKHAEGKRSLDLHGSPGLGGVSQTF